MKLKFVFDILDAVFPGSRGGASFHIRRNAVVKENEVVDILALPPVAQ